MFGECGICAFLMATKVTAHFADRLFPLPEKLAATTFGMCCCSDTTLELLLALGADEEPPSKALRAANFGDQLSFNF